MRPNITKLRCALVIAASACVAAGSAAAGENDPLKLILAETLMHDDNVFRTSGSTAPIADTITSTNFKLTLDTHLGRQHLQVALSQTDNRYKSLSYLNNTASNYMLAWQGEFRGRWTTDASWSHSDSLANFADVRNTLAKDIVTAESASFRLGYLPHPDWPIYVQLANSNASNSAATLAINDLRTNSTEIGLQYNSPLGNQATLLVRKTSGHYPYLTSLDSDYSQDDIQAGVRWKPGIKSALSLQIGHTRREEDGQPQLNFSGPTEHLTFDWAPMAMTSINATMGRDITPITAITVQGFYLVNYALVQSYGIGALWALTSKVSAGPRIDYQSREVAGVPLDKTTGSSLVLQYAPIRAVQMSMQLKHEVRESDIPGIPYVSNVGMLTATLSF